ncbi:Endonuclease/exonuclease/phosphatase [Trema orientale]|uniref:Endonuclease/exonuclease/phosphatase n=1 Tax=Trema orientale TaxID=63057 RepID=A0A2P5EES9_TREOI|nr:Endonuclease/exonuclease/phosphatase [Trema orientale]
MEWMKEKKISLTRRGEALRAPRWLNEDFGGELSGPNPGLDRQVMELKFRSLGFPNFCYEPPVGRAEGFCVAWRQGLFIEPMEVSKHLIRCIVHCEPSLEPWMLAAVYGPSRDIERATFWEKVKNEASVSNLPWLLVGDLNSTLFSSERSGLGTSRHAQQRSTTLCRCVEELGLIDLGVIGGKFSWRNRRFGKAFTQARLDRALCNMRWR